MTVNNVINKSAESVQLQQQEQRNVVLDGNIYSSSASFALAQRMANALSSSTIVPRDYQGNIGNCLIALEMSNRIKVSPIMVMQNLYIVNGRPAWSSQYIVAMINRSGRYKTELQYQMDGQGDSLSCYAWAEDHNGHKVKGPVITMTMAKGEGWVSKNGSKWKTMPEVMIRYRAASFFGRLNCPDMIMGIGSVDEVVEMDADYTIVDEIVSGELHGNVEAEGIASSVDKDEILSEAVPKTEPVIEETPEEQATFVAADPRDRFFD